MKYFPLVWGAILRKPAQTLLVFAAVTAGFTLFGVMLGLRVTYDRLVESTRQDRLDSDPRFPSAHGLRLPLGMREQMLRIDGVSAVGAYDLLRGYYQDPHNTGVVRAVDPAMRVGWSQLPVTTQQWDLLFSVPRGVLLSHKIAQQWKLNRGDVFPFMAVPNMRADGAPFWEFEVLDIVPDSPSSVDGFILGNFTYVDRSRPLEDQGTAVSFRVAVQDAIRADEISAKIDRLFANSSAPTITIPEKSNIEFAVHSGISAANITWPVAGAGLFMILLLTANAIAQSVSERIPEFAVMKTLGFQDTMISALVFTEAAIPCLCAALAGTLLAGVLSSWPIRFLPPGLGHLPKPTLSPWVLMSAVGCVLLLVAASSVVPILRLKRLSIVDALAGR